LLPSAKIYMLLFQQEDQCLSSFSNRHNEKDLAKTLHITTVEWKTRINVIAAISKNFYATIVAHMPHEALFHS
jgi:hypothetical protein